MSDKPDLLIYVAALVCAAFVIAWAPPSVGVMVALMVVGWWGGWAARGLRTWRAARG